MPTLLMSKGGTRKLPGATFHAGLGWDPADGGTDKIDLDLWVVRVVNGVHQAICWANEDWHAPELGQNSQGSPFVATPERDVIYKGDDRTGAESDTGFDENANLELGSAPDGTTQYQVYATYYEENNTGSTLGMATNVTFALTDETTGNALVVKLADEHSFDVTVLIATIDKNPDNTWSLTAKQEGFTDDMLTIAGKLKIT